MRWVNNVFHILLKIWHIIVWFGPNCSGKSTPSFRIYDMITKYAEMSFSPCVYNRKNVHYVANGIIWTWPPVVVMFTCCFILYRCWCNVWWCVTHRHPSKQCPAYLSTNIVLTAGYATHVWNCIMSSCRKIHDPYISLKKHLTLYQKVLHANESAGSYIYILSVTLRTWKKRIEVSIK